MIRSIIVTNYLGESITLDLMRPELSGFVIKNISGIGSGTATINLIKRSTSDGELYSSSRISSRNIVFDFLFYGDDIESIRQKSYKYFPLKKKIRLDFMLDNIEAYIEGYVESNDPKIFSKSEGTNVSIICPYPYFYALNKNKNIVMFSGVEKSFEFPFSNESLSESLLEFSSISIDTEKNLLYTGDGEIGITITIHAIGNVGDITFYNLQTREYIFIDASKIAAATGYGIIEGDIIVINTVVGNKYVRLYRNSEAINILNCMSIDSSWLQLSKGDNPIAIVAESGINNIQLSIEYDTIYEGL